MIVPIILISLGALVLTFFLIEKIKAYSLKAVALKTIASLLFIALGAYSLSKSNLAILPMFVVIALALGMVGDIALDLKYVFKEKDFEFTLAGFISFGLYISLNLSSLSSGTYTTPTFGSIVAKG